jgi:hypothetical protein
LGALQEASAIMALKKAIDIIFIEVLIYLVSKIATL